MLYNVGDDVLRPMLPTPSSTNTRKYTLTHTSVCLSLHTSLSLSVFLSVYSPHTWIWKEREREREREREGEREKKKQLRPPSLAPHTRTHKRKKKEKDNRTKCGQRPNKTKRHKGQRETKRETEIDKAMYKSGSHKVTSENGETKDAAEGTPGMSCRLTLALKGNIMMKCDLTSKRQEEPEALQFGIFRSGDTRCKAPKTSQCSLQLSLTMIINK